MPMFLPNGSQLDLEGIQSVGNSIEKTKGSIGSEEHGQDGVQQHLEQQQDFDDSGQQALAERCIAISSDQAKPCAGL